MTNLCQAIALFLRFSSPVVSVTESISCKIDSCETAWCEVEHANGEIDHFMVSLCDDVNLSVEPEDED